MSERQRIVVWALVGLTLIALAVPWFLWGSGTVVSGLPVWLWWHIGWLGLTAAVFYVFTQRAWGLGVERGDLDAGGEQRG